MFKFVHIADTHLDSVILSDKNNRDLILDSVEKSFKAAVNLCIEENCDALMISGDLFDDDHLTFRTELMLRDSFDRLNQKDICVFYCLGNHDPKSSKLRKFKLGGNVHVFDDESPESIEVKDAEGKLIGIVAGVGYSAPRVEENLAKKFKIPKIDADVPVVGMLHTSLDIGGEKVYSPCTYNDLAALPFDYWALGHIHKTTVYGDDRPAVFPGCTCGRDFGETGPKGAYLVSLDKKGVSTYEFKELADIKWYDIEVDGFEEADDAAAMQKICTDKINAQVDENSICFVRLSLKGQCPLYEHFDEEARADLQDSLTKVTGTSVTLVNSLSSVINPDEYLGDRHLLSIALQMAKDVKNNDELKNEIIEIINEQYKGLDGGDSPEYIQSLLQNIDKRLCEVMIKQED